MYPSTYSSEYLAPYHRLPPGQTTNRDDIIYFRDGHTLEKHLEAIDSTAERARGRYQSRIYQRSMNKDELERVRRDSGVEKVVQVTREMEKAIRKEDRTVVTYPGFRAAPGYMVLFTTDAYTLEKHFAKIGETFNEADVLTGTGYSIRVPESKIERIFTDPNVYVIEQNTYGKMC